MAAWLTAYYGRVKRLPPLQAEIKRQSPKRDQTSAEQMAKAKDIADKFGGVIRKNG